MNSMSMVYFITKLRATVSDKTSGLIMSTTSSSLPYTEIKKETYTEYCGKEMNSRQRVNFFSNK